MAVIKLFFQCSGQSQTLRPYTSTDSTEALKKRILRSLLRLDFHTTVASVPCFCFPVLEVFRRLIGPGATCLSFAYSSIVRSPCRRGLYAMYSVLLLFM